MVVFSDTFFSHTCALPGLRPVEQNFFFPDGFHMTSPRICSNVIDLSNCPPLGQSLWWGD